MSTNAYQGELLGLMALYLILLSVNKVAPNLEGSMHIYSDRLGVLDQVEHLLLYRIPTRCQYLHILKNMLVNCSNLTLRQIFSHAKAHQDDDAKFHNMLRPSQLSCACDARAKGELRQQLTDDLHKQQAFPLELRTFVGKEKMTSDTGSHTKFWAQQKLTQEFFFSHGILLPH